MVLAIGTGLFSNRIFQNSPNDNEVLSFQGNTQRPSSASNLLITSTTGYTAPSTVTDDATVGTETWLFDGVSYVTALATNDGAYAYTSSPDVTHYLKCTNFGFEIPAGAIITGIKVKIWRLDHSGTGTTLFDNSVKLVKNGVIGGDDKPLLTALPTVEAYSYYGGSGDLWGETWTAEDINQDNFGVAYSGNRDAVFEDYFINSIQINVYYLA